MNNKYVLIITIHADPAMPPGYGEWGGTHTYMRELLDGFTKNRQYCILVTRLSMRFLPEMEKYSDYCTIYRLKNGPAEPIDKLKLWEYHDINIKKIKQIIAAQETLPQIIHSVYWNSGRIAMELSRYYGIPFVHSIISNSRGRVARGAKEDLPQRAVYEQQIYDSAKELLCVSQDEKNDLIKYYNIKPNKITVAGQYISDSFLYPAHDLNDFPRINCVSAQKYAQKIGDEYNPIFYKDCNNLDNFWSLKVYTYFGRMDVNKGVHFIIKAWYLLYQKYKDLCPPIWLVGGSLPEIERLRSIIKKDIPDLVYIEKIGKIIWWGYLDFQGLSTVLLRTMVVIMHSLYEPGGRVAVEAMSEKIPVIATSNGFAKDIIKNWQNGFLVEYGNISELACRMEHFLRQPLLSNSLGKEAANCANSLIQEWDFMNSHFHAYGIKKDSKAEAMPVKKNARTFPVNAYDFTRNINIYPYLSFSVSDEYVLKYFEKRTGMKGTLDDSYQHSAATSNLWKIKTSTDNYIAKQYVTRLAVSPLINPIDNEKYHRQAKISFFREWNIYQRLKSNIAILCDKTHFILYLKELKVQKKYDEHYLWYCLEYMMTSFKCLTKVEQKNAEKWFQVIPNSLDDIENYIFNLQSCFPDFYFECSGFFSPNLCWNIARHIIEYNKTSFKQNEWEFLQHLCDTYGKSIYTLKAENFYMINLEAECKHILWNDSAPIMIDFEKISIGPIESMIASFLYNYCSIVSIPSIKNFFRRILQSTIIESVNHKMLLSLIAYHSFYNYVYNKVLHFQDLENDVLFLKELEEVYDECSGLRPTSR